jgi:hypothetical protein
MAIARVTKNILSVSKKPTKRSKEIDQKVGANNIKSIEFLIKQVKGNTYLGVSLYVVSVIF